MSVCRKDPESVAIRALYNNKKSCARGRGISWALDFDLYRILIAQPCHYCGIESSCLFDRGSEWPVQHNGLDRVDSSRGYEEGNVVPCCDVCNRAKGALSIPAFEGWVERVSNRLDQLHQRGHVSWGL